MWGGRKVGVGREKERRGKVKHNPQKRGKMMKAEPKGQREAPQVGGDRWLAEHHDQYTTCILYK